MVTLLLAALTATPAFDAETTMRRVFIIAACERHVEREHLGELDLTAYDPAIRSFIAKARFDGEKLSPLMTREQCEDLAYNQRLRQRLTTSSK